MTEKRFKFRRFNVDIANINEIVLYEIDNNPSDDLDESNLFYVYSTIDANVQHIVDKLNSQEETIQRLKRIMKDVAELLSIEADLFSDKAIEHDINAYIELKEFDNKDAYYMAVSIKKAIKMLKSDVE